MILVRMNWCYSREWICNSRGKICWIYCKGVKRQQGFTTGAAFYVYNVISFNLKMVHHDGLVVIISEILISDSRSIPRWGGYDLLLDV